LLPFDLGIGRSEQRKPNLKLQFFTIKPAETNRKLQFWNRNNTTVNAFIPYYVTIFGRLNLRALTAAGYNRKS